MFYIDLSIVEPYIKYLRRYRHKLTKFIEKNDLNFSNVRKQFDDTNVEKFISTTNEINNILEMTISTIDDYATTMKKEAVAYRKYLGGK